MLAIPVKILGSNGNLEPIPLILEHKSEDEIFSLKETIGEEEGYSAKLLTLYFATHGSKQSRQKIMDDKKKIQDFNLKIGYFIVEFPMCSSPVAPSQRLSLVDEDLLSHLCQILC